MAATIFDILKRITFSKEDWDSIPEEEQKTFNKWTIYRFLSMKEEYCEVINFIQKSTWAMENKYVYTLLKDVFPKSNVFLKYIKAKNKKEYDSDKLETLMKHFEISKKHAKEYYNIIPEEELNYIHSIYNQQNKPTKI